MEYDVIVVGAGPAGVQTTLGLAGRGYSILLLDAEERIGDKPCTGIVSSECVSSFHVPSKLVWHEGRKLLVFPSDGDPLVLQRQNTQAFVIDRGRFVRSISEQAASAGAEVKLGWRVTDLQINGTGVSVTASSKHGTGVFGAKALVVASGFMTKLAETVGLTLPKKNGYAAQAKITEIDIEVTHVFARKHVPSTFFGWMVPTSAGEGYLGVLGREKPLDAFWGLANGLLADHHQFKIDERPRVWGVPLQASTLSYSERCIAVGDAAGQVKPTTGGGIYFALIGAVIATDVLANALAKNDLSVDTLQEYQRRWKAALGREIKLGYLARLFYEKLGDEDLERLLRSAESSGLFEKDIAFDDHSSILKIALKSTVFLSVLRALPGIRS